MSKFLMVREWVGKNKVLAGLTAASLAIAGYSERDVILPQTSAVSQATIAEKPMGTTIKGEMHVAGGKTFSSVSLLNDKKYNAKDSSILTLAVPVSLCPDAKALIGKTVRFEGTKSEYDGKPQIAVTKLEVK